MNKFTLKPAAWIWIASLLPVLFACSDQEKDPSLLSLSTVKVIQSNDFYFALDDGKTLYPSNLAEMGGYKAIDGQRAFVQYLLSAEKISGYDYQAEIVRIEDVETKEILPYSGNVKDKDRINIINAWKAGGYLNVEYFYYGNGRDEDAKRHLFTMIIDRADNETEADDQILHLRFLHESYGDTYQDKCTGLISFPLRNLAEGKKKIEIFCRTIYEGGETYTVTDQPVWK
ncbi:MAG: NigD-like protein [Prevotellaceae bacterium]|jgi:hypothetical protein|nr:NigD-like protein [Prevotellaceae bacterium]